MVRPITVIALCVFSIFSSTATLYAKDSTATLRVTVTNIADNKGNLLVTVYSNADGFPMKPEKALIRKVIDLSSSQSSQKQLDFTLEAAGDYAVAAVHDKNADKKLSLSLIGIPNEPTGVSNNAKGKMGPPSFKDARLRFPETDSITITLN